MWVYLCRFFLSFAYFSFWILFFSAAAVLFGGKFIWDTKEQKIWVEIFSSYCCYYCILSCCYSCYSCYVYCCCCCCYCIIMEIMTTIFFVFFPPYCFYCKGFRLCVCFCKITKAKLCKITFFSFSFAIFLFRKWIINEMRSSYAKFIYCRKIKICFLFNSNSLESEKMIRGDSILKNEKILSKIKKNVIKGKFYKYKKRNLWIEKSIFIKKNL